MNKNDWYDLTAFIGFIAVFALTISALVTGLDGGSRTPIPGTDCEAVEIYQNNVWFTPGENTVTNKIVCTTEVDKVDIGR